MIRNQQQIHESKERSKKPASYPLLASSPTPPPKKPNKSFVPMLLTYF